MAKFQKIKKKKKAGMWISSFSVHIRCNRKKLLLQKVSLYWSTGIYSSFLWYKQYWPPKPRAKGPPKLTLSFNKCSSSIKRKKLPESLSLSQEMGKNYFSDHMADQKCQESLASVNRIGKWSVKEQYTKWHKGGHIWSPNDWKTNIQADCYADIL